MTANVPPVTVPRRTNVPRASLMQHSMPMESVNVTHIGLGKTAACTRSKLIVTQCAMEDA